MKKLYTLVLALAMVNFASAQSTGKHGSAVNSSGGKTSYSSASKSSSSGTSHSSGNHGSVSSSGSSANYETKSGTSSTRMTRLEDKKVQPKTEAKIIQVREAEKTDGGITPVNREPSYPYYEEKDKGKDPVIYIQPDSQDPGSSDNHSGEETDTANTVTTHPNTALNNGIRPGNTIITCDDLLAMNRNGRWNIFNSYERFDLSQTRRCHNPFPIEDQWVVTCAEFEKSSDERKRHILNYPEFYNIVDLKNCDSYLKFMESFTPESEE